MNSIIKHLKPFIFYIIAVIILLSTQAISDLALPEYMSNIVNKGVQQGGIDDSVPTVIRKSELDKVMFFVEDDYKGKIKSSYKLIDKKELSNNEYNDYVKKYPLLEKEPLYELKEIEKEADYELVMARALLIVYGIENNESLGFDNNFEIPEGVDPFLVISTISKEHLEIMMDKIDAKLETMPESMLIQSATIYIKNEYKTIGIDTDAIQNNYIIITGLKMIGIALLSMTAAVLVAYTASLLSSGLARNLRKSLFSKVESFSSAEFEKFGTASLITRTTNDINQIQHMMTMLLRVVFYAPILGIGGFIKVTSTDMSMGWIIGLTVAVILIIVIILFIFVIPKFKLVQKLIDKLSLVTRESLTGMLVIRAFNTENHEEKKFDKANKDLTKVNLFINQTMALMFPLMMLIMNVVTIVIVWIGAHQINEGIIQVGDMMAFIQYTMQIISAFLMISMSSIMLPRASVAAGRIDAVLKTETTIADPLEPKSFDKNIKGHIKFENVSFKYPDASDCVIKNISFEAKPGQTTAFIGSTGSGKSTIVNLIPRFYDTTEGEILIDDVNIKDVKQDELRNNIGYIPQKGILFTGTISSNLKYGNQNATKKELEEASSVAQALSFINAKSNKFKASIAEGGANLSGGQKQRLSIARALVKKPKIYIFDDAFSALDFKTDATLRKALKERTSDSTILIVAQRISTIMKADQIIVLEKGKIVGKGTHAELMKKCKVYKEIALSQLSKEELA